MSEAGFDRVRGLPEVMSDDLALSEAFSSHERCITTTAHVRVRPAATWRSLVQRRVRVTIGTRRLAQSGLAGPASLTRGSDLVRLGLANPRLAVRIPLFVATAVWVRTLARHRVRRGLGDVWLRDESSRPAHDAAVTGEGTDDGTGSTRADDQSGCSR